MTSYLEKDFNFNFNNQNIETESIIDENDSDFVLTPVIGQHGIRRSSTKQNQQFNNLVVNKCNVTSLHGSHNQSLYINSSLKDNQNIVFNKLITINNEGDLTVARNINLVDITSNVSIMNKLYNSENNLIWGDDVVVTDATLKTELESLNLSQLTFCNDDYNKSQTITIKSSISGKEDYSITLPSIKPEKDSVLGIIDNDGNMDWVSKTNLPIGMVVMFYGKNIPEGWLECNGQIISKNDYSKLYQIVYDNDGNDEIKLPDLSNHYNGIKMIIKAN
jgi:hypothetical protein